MIRALLPFMWLVAACGSALADDGSPLLEQFHGLIHPTITLFGTAVAAKLALDAFGRRPVPVADVPTFPRYMTSPQQYRLGKWMFVVFACGFFLLLVYDHREVVAAAAVFGDWVPKNILPAVVDESAPYLLVIAAMGAVYLYFLTKETQWNGLLLMRDVIQGWISIPQLAGQIVAQIRFSLRVPQPAVAAVIASSTGVVEQDFHKDRNTPDRIWVETCYMKWWLTQGQDAGEDATFFTEESFGFDRLLGEFDQAAWAMGRWKSGAAPDLALSNLFQTLKELHNKFSRLVACYLIYRNDAKTELCAEARKFGIEMNVVAPENPLRYWIVYVIVLMASVYLGVYVSAVVYDLLAGKGLIIEQDADRMLAWMMYSLCNYGLAIMAILLLRYLTRSGEGVLSQSHLITYSWTFVVALVVGPLGLALAVHVFGQGAYQKVPLEQLYFQMLKWGFGPALVCVYISYYLDRQTYRDLPNIDHSPATFGWRLLNCFGFAAITLFLLLPALMSLPAQPPGAAWDTAKLRFVATGVTFCVAFGLALAAQFALRKGTPANGSVLAPQATA